MKRADALPSVMTFGGESMTEAIDLITLSPSGDVVYFVMSEMGSWNGSKDRLCRIQSRFNDYLMFALDGEFARRFPEHAGKKVHVRIDCDHVPDPTSSSFLDKLEKVGEQSGVSLSVDVCWTAVARPATASDMRTARELAERYGP